MRDQGAYLILRELHSWEPEPDVRGACEKLIQVGAAFLWGGREEEEEAGPQCASARSPACTLQVLIGDEPERGMENLLEVQVPEEVERQLEELDRREREQCQREQQQRKEQLSPEPPAEGAAPT